MNECTYMKETAADTVWYSKGLRFRCTGCGKCCTGAPGVVWVSDEEAKSIASFLGISHSDFLLGYTRMMGEKRALKEIGKTWDCVFLKMKKQCAIYSVRPKQCQTFPWWKGVVESQKEWEQTKQYCEGIDHPQGPLFSQEEIERLL